VNLVLRQIFTNGFFSRRSASGNILVLADGRFCFLDYGAVGIVSASLRHHLGVILYGVIYKDRSASYARCRSSLPSVSSISTVWNTKSPKSSSNTRRRRFSEIKVRDLLDRFGRITAENHLRFVPGFYLLFKRL